MNDARDVIKRKLEQVRVIDPHCHLRLDKPSADDLADIVLYHHVWIELVSAGMGQSEVTETGLPHEVADPRTPASERVRRALPYLPRIENTTLGLFLRWILKDLYGIERLSEANLDTALSLAAERGASPDWQEEVLRRRCGIDTSISVSSEGKPYSGRMLRGREFFPGRLVTGKQTAAETLVTWELGLGHEIVRASDYRDFLIKSYEDLSPDAFKFLGWWVAPSMNEPLATEEEVTRTLGQAKEGKPVREARAGGVCLFAMRTLLAALRATKQRTIQLIVGAEVLPPHRSITHWQGSFAGAFGRVANEFEDFHFNVMAASDAFTQDIAVLAKHLPNVSVAGYWWHTLYPRFIRKSLETRLDMVPLNKTVGFFSDAYHAEWIYPKLKMVKEILGEILLERVEKGWYSTETAVNIINAFFHDNPKRIYGL
jgi:hypothetical protein